MMTVSDYIIKRIEELGVKTVFHCTGGMCMFLTEALRKSNLEIVFPFHEQNSVCMADGYAQITNNIGIAIVTAGPGILNTVTAIAASYADSIPLLIIAGQAKTTDFSKTRSFGVQGVNIIDVMKPITTFAIELYDNKNIKYFLDNAILYATAARKGPSFISVPLDVQNLKTSRKKSTKSLASLDELLR